MRVVVVELEVLVERLGVDNATRIRQSRRLSQLKYCSA
jgi:hypothetical protein